jgi:hypothetical protein
MRGRFWPWAGRECARSEDQVGWQSFAEFEVGQGSRTRLAKVLWIRTIRAEQLGRLFENVRRYRGGGIKKEIFGTRVPTAYARPARSSTVGSSPRLKAVEPTNPISRRPWRTEKSGGLVKTDREVQKVAN